MIHPLATAVLGPVLLVQGHAVRRRVVKLPEPPGDRIGESGEGPELRLMLTGDSSAAGVGADHQERALLGRTVTRLTDAFRVHWRLEAKTGDCTADTLARLRALPEERFDVVVTSLGVNDITSGRTRATFRAQQRELRSLLRDRFGASLLVVSGLPPVRHFPALPQPLRWYLDRRAREFDGDLRSDVEREAGVRWIALEFPLDPSLVATDGFHPGPRAYDRWGQLVAGTVREIRGAVSK